MEGPGHMLCAFGAIDLQTKLGFEGLGNYGGWALRAPPVEHQYTPQT